MTLPRRPRARGRLGRRTTSTGVATRPCAAAVSPGEVRAALPAAPPEQRRAVRRRAARPRRADRAGAHALEPSAVLRLVREHGLRARDPRRAADAALNVNAMTWLSSPAATELELVTMDWLAQLLGLPRGLHGHIEDTASTSTVAALAAARTLRPGGVVYASEQANFSVEKAARLVGLEFRDGRGRRRRTGCAPTSRSTTRPRSSRRSGRPATTSVDPVAAARRSLRGGGRLAARRRGVRGLGGGLSRASLVPRRLRPRRLDRRQPAQVAVHADGLLGALDAAARRAAGGVRAARPTTSPRPATRST